MSMSTLTAPKSTRTPAGYLTGYLTGYDAASLPAMTRDEEVAAFTALRAGDESQRDRIVCANMRFAIKIASATRGAIGI